jgi:penicillin amidase
VFGGGVLSLAAPFSGEAWTAADDNVDAPPNRLGTTTVDSPYGPATVRYDASGVPHVTADSERAAYYAIGYVHARDRLFQMDLIRRQMSGELSEAFGERAVETDRFHRKMDFERAAAASWAAIEDTETGAAVEAYTAGVNRSMESRPLPTEFTLNGYEPDAWTPTDTLLVGKQIAWALTGDFRDLERRTVRERLPAATELYPRQLDHDSPVIRDGADGGREPVTGDRAALAAGGADRVATDTDPPLGGDPGALYESLRRFERDAALGSNNWVVSGEHTASGKPLLANDPHLSLMAPPVWYEQHVVVEGEYDVRGVTFPGSPSVIIGANEEVSWGVTNVGADQTDLYSYVRPSNDTYLYEGEVREVQRRTETIRVSGGEDVTVTVERTVHGPLIEREGTEVAVAWVGLTATEEARAVRGFNDAGSMSEFREAARYFDTPTQNLVAIDHDGGTFYRATGRYPLRRVDGETVRGDRVFNGSAGHGEWAGFTPYGQSTWEGFVPLEENPQVLDPGYLATANQRVVDEPGFYLSTSDRYADPYRGQRIYGLLDRRVDAGEPVTPAYMRAVQRDTRSAAAAALVPQILESRSAMDPETREAASSLEGWDYRMERDSRPALLYSLFREAYVNETLYDEYHPAGLDEGYYPHLYTIGELPADSDWFDDDRTPGRETRADIVARAMAEALDRAEREGYETYGDYNVVDIDHPFPVAALDYPERPTDGGPFTVFNFRAARSTQAGSSWRMVAVPPSEGPSYGVIPGGQSGNPFSPHYHDQLDPWAEGEYRTWTHETEGRVVVRFVEGGDE